MRVASTLATCLNLHTCAAKWAEMKVCHLGRGEGGRGALFFEDAPLVAFMSLVFTRMPGKSYRRRFRSLCLCPLVLPRSGELRTQKLKSHLVRTQSLNVLPLKPGVGQYIAIHATLTARDFSFAYFYPSGPFTCIFSESCPNFS